VIRDDSGAGNAGVLAREGLGRERATRADGGDLGGEPMRIGGTVNGLARTWIVIVAVAAATGCGGYV
jgi:hypothetical protein